MILNIYITFAIAFAGGCLFVWAWVNFRRGLKTRHWIKTEGEVVSSHVEQSGTTIEFDHPTYQLHAKVKYTVDGRTYQASNMSDFIGYFSSIGKPGTLPRKSIIFVYYNPANPKEAVLSRSAFRFAIFLALLGIGFVALEWHWVSKTFF